MKKLMTLVLSGIENGKGILFNAVLFISLNLEPHEHITPQNERYK